MQQDFISKVDFEKKEVLSILVYEFSAQNKSSLEKRFGKTDWKEVLLGFVLSYCVKILQVCSK